MELMYSFTFFLLLLLIFFWLPKPFYQRNIHKLPPGPPLSLPLIGHLYLFKNPLHRTLAKISDKYGHVLLLHFGYRRVLVVTSPSVAEECFKKNDIVFANRPKFLAGKHLGYDYTTLTWAPHGDHWRNLRRIASTELLSTHRIQMFTDVRRDEVRSLVTRLRRGGGTGDDNDYRVVELKSAFFGMMLNIMMRMIGGKQYYDDDDKEEEQLTSLEERRKFQDIVNESLQFSGANNIGDFLPFLRWIGIDKTEHKLKLLQEKRDRLMQDLIDEHRRAKHSPEQRKQTLISILLSLQETNPESYTDQIIKGMMITMYAAGTDTSASTMEWAMSLLLNNPQTIIETQNEIDAVVGDSRLIEDSDLPNLPYLQGIITETMRMYPTVPLLVPHQSSADCFVGGYRVPRGTILLVNMWSIQNDPKFWDETMRFKPQRFVNGGGEVQQQEGFVMLPFGSGRRRCPGENLAKYVVGLTLGSLIQCFDWVRIGVEPVDMTEGSGLTMPKDRSLVAKCRPRQTMEKLILQI